MTSSGYVVVLLRPDVAEQASGDPNAVEPVTSLRARGFDLRPLHEGADDPEGKRSFFVPAETLDDPEETARTIAGIDGVEAAYYTPPGEAP